MIKLNNNRFNATIDPFGGWLTDFSDKDGDILYPRKSFTYPDGSVKQRGGSHVCLPNFGPGGDTDLPQHGFGRISEWEILKQSKTFVGLKLKSNFGAYKGLISQLTYELTSDGLTIGLELYNAGMKSLPIAPGFHPYFKVDNKQNLKIRDDVLELSTLSEMKLIKADNRVVGMSNRNIQLSSPMQFWAHWTDKPREYICIEPTLKGNAFLDKNYIQLKTNSQFKTFLSIEI